MTQVTGTFPGLYAGMMKKARKTAGTGMQPMKRQPRPNKAPKTLSGRRTASHIKALDSYGF